MLIELPIQIHKTFLYLHLGWFFLSDIVRAAVCMAGSSQFLFVYPGYCLRLCIGEFFVLRMISLYIILFVVILLVFLPNYFTVVSSYLL